MEALKMEALKNPRHHFIPELSLEAHPTSDSHLFQVPGARRDVQGKRSPKTCHAPMDWTGYWVGRMRQELARRNFPTAAANGYAAALEGFLTENPGAPSKHGPDVIGAYLLEKKDQGNLGVSSVGVILAAVVLFYRHVLKAPQCVAGIPGAQGNEPEKTERKPVQGFDKIRDQIDKMSDGKARLMLSLTAACGLREQELGRLKLADLDLDRRLIRLRKRRGSVNGERIVMIPSALAGEIGAYMKSHAPIVYLFESGRAGKPLTGKTLRAVSEKAAALRLPETGMDLRFTQTMLGYAT